MMNEDGAAEFAVEVLESERPGEWTVDHVEVRTWSGWTTFWIHASNDLGHRVEAAIEEYLPEQFRYTENVAAAL